MQAKLYNTKSYHYFRIVLWIALFFTSSCSKYEDGPFFSILSPKQRLAREWKVEFSLNLSTGVSHSAEYDGWVLKFDKGGTFSYKTIYNQIETNYNGYWDIVGKNQLNMVYDENSGDRTEFYTILRLTRKELWLISSLEEIHYYAD